MYMAITYIYIHIHIFHTIINYIYMLTNIEASIYQTIFDRRVGSFFWRPLETRPSSHGRRPCLNMDGIFSLSHVEHIAKF